MSAIPAEAAQLSRSQLFQVFSRPGDLTSDLLAPPVEPETQVNDPFSRFLEYLRENPNVDQARFYSSKDADGKPFCTVSVSMKLGHTLPDEILTPENYYFVATHLTYPPGSRPDFVGKTLHTYYFLPPTDYCPPGASAGQPDVAPQNNPSLDNNSEFSSYQSVPTYTNATQPELPSNWMTIAGGIALTALALAAFIRSRFKLAYS